MRNKISSKIIICVVVCSILISAVVGITSIKEATSVIKNEAYGKILNMASSKGNEYSVQINKTENSVKEYAQIIADAIDMSKIQDADYMESFENEFDPLTKSMGISNKGIVGLYINFNPNLTKGEGPYDIAYDYDDKTGVEEVSNNSYTIDDYDESKDDLAWYYGAVKAKAGVWTKPYIDSESNENMISYTLPVYKDNQLIGVAGLDISFDSLKKMILDTNLYDTGSAFLMDKDYTFLVDKEKNSEDNLNTMEDGKYNYVTEDIGNKKESVIEVNFEGKKNVIGYYTLSNGQIIGVRVPTEEVFKTMNNLIYIIALVIVAGLILSIGVALYISRKISRPIEMATKLIKKLANLDLTDNEEDIGKLVSNRDETGLMMQSLIKQRDELIKIIKVLKKNSLEVLQHSDIIATDGNETVESITLISTTMEELSGRAEEQAKEVNSGLVKLNGLADEIEVIVGGMSKLGQYSVEMQKVREQGSQAISILEKKLKVNVEAAMSVGKNIDELSKKSNLVGEIITMISSISKQTSILSLNASIESEKAGQSGKGFAIISEELRKLSERSAEATIEIQKIVSDIQNEISLGKENMDNSKVAIEEANNVMIISNEAFKDIGQSVNNTMKQIKSLEINIEKVNRDKEEVLESIEEISVITEELALSVEHVTENIGRQEVAMKSTSERTEELKKVSGILSSVVEKFKS